MSENKCPPAKPCKKGAPGWMVTFADLMSLLMAFFALLYAMSSIEDHKFREVATSLQSVFGDAKSGIFEFDGKTIIEMHPDSPVENDQQENEKFEQMAEMIQEIYEPQENVQVEVNPDDQTVQLTFEGEALFRSGSADLLPQFRVELRRMFPVRDIENAKILVRGHTDRVPLTGSRRFRTNWDLSASRAASVGEYLLDLGFVKAENLKVEGRADSMPISTLGDFANYSKDRRVEIIISLEEK
ncbi:flagellar motor protein MotB [Thiomicrospira sp. R3]|uniref:OmpA/MotB family protein n=1 Tax=Thiomicrospira sp. R3 TaxID=3035472 RepID=UPI00259B59DD|nr:flagellar motor protein MotB [Thiomicrospira sp. R3]WFE69626.1 flagellar motor protein MotB [Thiomicrospira sp. R3]